MLDCDMNPRLRFHNISSELQQFIGICFFFFIKFIEVGHVRNVSFFLAWAAPFWRTSLRLTHSWDEPSYVIYP